MTIILKLEEVMKLKGGENSHLSAELLTAVDESGNPLGKNVYSPEYDLGAKARIEGWTNIGDISACLRTSIGLGEIYKDSETPHIAVASKHTRPVVIANGRTQLEAVIKAIAGDLNSPFGGMWGFNTPIVKETAEFFNRPDMFFEGMVAPEYEKGTDEILKHKHKNRFLIQTGHLSSSDLDIFGYRLQPVVPGKFLKESLEPKFDVRKEAVVVTGNQGNSDIASLDDGILKDIAFAGNAAIYLSSNLVFFAYNGAVAGLGDGCGARTDAAEKARRKLEVSAYAALSRDGSGLWDAVLFDTPFSREDFEIIPMPLRLIVFSDAFFPKLDGFVEASGIDRLHKEFGARQVIYTEGDAQVRFIPKRNNYDPNYDRGLIPAVVVQPGGSLGDKVILPIAEQYGIKMAFTMTPEMYNDYYAKGKRKTETGEQVTGRRFFGHIIM